MTGTSEEMLRVLRLQARGYKGWVHGDDPTGVVDIEFPSIHHASTFADTMLHVDEMFGAYLLSARLRDPVTSLFEPVTLIVTVNPDYPSPYRTDIGD